MTVNMLRRQFNREWPVNIAVVSLSVCLDSLSRSLVLLVGGQGRRGPHVWEMMTICNLDGVNPLDRNSWRTSVRRCLPRSLGQPHHHNQIWWWWCYCSAPQTTRGNLHQKQVIHCQNTVFTSLVMEEGTNGLTNGRTNRRT